MTDLLIFLDNLKCYSYRFHHDRLGAIEAQRNTCDLQLWRSVVSFYEDQQLELKGKSLFFSYLSLYSQTANPFWISTNIPFSH